MIGGAIDINVMGNTDVRSGCQLSFGREGGRQGITAFEYHFPQAL